MKKRNALIEAHIQNRQVGDSLSIVFKYGNGITYFDDPKNAPKDLLEKFKSITKDVVLNEKVRDLFFSNMDLYFYDLFTKAAQVQIFDYDEGKERILSGIMVEDGDVPVAMDFLQKIADYCMVNEIDFYFSSIMLGKQPFDGDYNKAKRFRNLLINNR